MTDTEFRYTKDSPAASSFTALLTNKMLIARAPDLPGPSQASSARTAGWVRSLLTNSPSISGEPYIVKVVISLYQEAFEAISRASGFPDMLQVVEVAGGRTRGEQPESWPQEWLEFDADISEPMTVQSLAAEQRRFQSENQQDWITEDLPWP